MEMCVFMSLFYIIVYCIFNLEYLVLDIYYYYYLVLVLILYIEWRCVLYVFLCYIIEFIILLVLVWYIWTIYGYYTSILYILYDTLYTL